MSNSMNNRRGNSRVRLLATVSMIALTAGGLEPALAAASDKEPVLWIDLGWQLETAHDSPGSLPLPLGDVLTPNEFTGPFAEGLHLSRSNSNDAKLIFHPDGTDWSFSASVRYGRSRGATSRHHLSTPIPSSTFTTFHTTIPTYPFPYHQTRTKPVRQKTNSFNLETISAESHLLLDFEAGRDVGLGLLGKGTLGVGVRIAQFRNSVNVRQFDANTDTHISEFKHTYPTFAFFRSIGVTEIVPWYKDAYDERWTSLKGKAQISHNFVGAGPSIYWDASSPLWGDTQHGGQWILDWGVNAAVLFGKQTNKKEFQTSGAHNCYGNGCSYGQHKFQDSGDITNTKRISVPNVGGFMGLSYRFRDAKVSVGYRADYFFRALNTDAPGQAITRGFRGPFASISLGVSD